MITKQDIEFSKKSYTNKDFPSLYPDLLDLAKQLTDLWNPAESNESDPGVVLLKEGAFIADHNNYNIDKNILEAFLPSATQETSVRNLVEMNGYTPRYYVSGCGKISFEYNIPDDADENIPQVLKIKPFSIKVTTEDGNITYTQGKDWITINNGDKDVTSVDFIEGTLSTLAINGVENITLDNLDDNNRLYFPVKYVAQNGIFISNSVPSGDINYSFWDQVEYILSQPLGSKVYKLDYDSSMGLPYVEFPSDIANLIESGLTVRYIVSSGVNGNVNANQLTKISSPANLLDRSTGEDIKVPTSYFAVSNPSSILNGKNPETIDEMYKSFKKVVHTFNTLVTCKDFQDAIYMMHDDNYVRYISNDIVTDIKTDYNNSIRVISYDELGSFVKNIALSNGLGRLKFQATKPEKPEVGDIIIEDGILKWYTYDKQTSERDDEGKPIPTWEPLEEISYDDFVRASEAITPFDICVYALKAFSMADYNKYFPWIAHAKSFEPVLVDYNTTNPDPTNPYNIIKNELYDISKYKCLNHQFKTPEAGDVICFKNYVPLYVTIIPYTKVSYQEKQDIFDNIYRALSINFNSGELDFGEELNYDTVYDVIVNADDRIKSIRLEDFVYYTNVLVMGKAEGDITEQGNQSKEYSEYTIISDDENHPVSEFGHAFFVDLVAKNVLAGRLCLFNIDNNFDYQYGQVNVEEYKNIKVITSEVKIPASDIVEFDDESTPYALLENEYIQVAWPNYYTDITYPQYVYYRFESTVPRTLDKGILEDTEYELQAGEKLTLVWTQNNTTQRKTYTAGQIIKPNFNLKVTEDTAHYTKTVDGENKPFDILNTREQIEHKLPLKTMLNSAATPVYWITQDGEKKLFKDNEYERFLNSGEYFIYSNKQKDAMVIFGAGTKLTRSERDTNTWSMVPNASIETINEQAYSADLNWQSYDFNNAPFYIEEMNVLTLSYGDTVSLSTGDIPETATIDNEWKHFNGSITYTVNAGTTEESTTTLTTNTGFNIRSRLDMTSDKYHSQELVRNQVITVTLADGTTHEIFNSNPSDPQVLPDTERLYYQVNTAIDVLGDSKTALEDYLANYSLDLRSFKTLEPVLTDTTTGDTETITTDQGDLLITMNYRNAEATVPLSYINSFNTQDTSINKYILSLFIDDSKITEESFIPINVWITPETLTAKDGTSINYKLTHYGRSDLDVPYNTNGLTLNVGGLHLLEIALTIPDSGESGQLIDINEDLTIHISWSAEALVNEFITLMKHKIIGGLNSNLKDSVTLEEVVDRIEELMNSSNDSKAIPYLTYIPEIESDMSKVLQNENLNDPKSLWDVNNVANPFTIAQIDIETMATLEDEKTGKIGTMDIIKSMKDYKE